MTPPRGRARLLLPSSGEGAAPFADWVSRAGAAAASFPRPDVDHVKKQHTGLAFAEIRKVERD